jgi:hypothetical protein
LEEEGEEVTFVIRVWIMVRIRAWMRCESGVRGRRARVGKMERMALMICFFLLRLLEV